VIAGHYVRVHVLARLHHARRSSPGRPAQIDQRAQLGIVEQ
jgi:hypothetical protein